MKRIRFILMIGLMIAGNVGFCQVIIDTTQKPYIIKGDDFDHPELVELLKLIKDSIKYPQKARELGIQGTVYVKFTENTDGTLSNFEISQGIGGGCDEEAIRVLKLLPKWKPCINKNGNSVPVYFKLPIKFTLPEKSGQENIK